MAGSVGLDITEDVGGLIIQIRVLASLPFSKTTALTPTSLFGSKQA